MVFPNPIRAVVFDMDGLLIDTERGFRDAFMAVAAARGHDLPLSLFHRMIGTSNNTSAGILRGYFGPAFDVEGLFAEASARFHEIVDLENLLKAGVVELLDHLDELGMPRAIATSSTRASVDRNLAPTGIVARFDAVVTRVDYAHGKPAPDPFLTAADKLGVAPANCLALEDSHNGVRAAHAAGMMTIMVPDLLEPTEEMSAKTVAIAESLHVVHDLLRTHGVAGI